MGPRRLRCAGILGRPQFRFFFTAPESKWTTFYWYMVYITCPPWLLPESRYSWLSWVETPLANGMLYAALALSI